MILIIRNLMFFLPRRQQSLPTASVHTKYYHPRKPSLVCKNSRNAFTLFLSHALPTSHINLPTFKSFHAFIPSGLHSSPSLFMEISSFQSISHEDDDFSTFYSFFQEMGDDNVNAGEEKRRRTYFDEDGGGAGTSILSSMDDGQLINNQTGFSQSILNFDDIDNGRVLKRSRSVGVKIKDCDDSGGARAASLEGETIKASGQQRRIWVKDRSKAWWDKCNHPDFPDEEFRRAFRMSKNTFDMICRELDSSLMKKNTMLRESIPVRQRVAVCIWRLATGDPLRMVSKRFGLGISTCHKLVLEVCSAIRTVLMPRYLKWPDEPQMSRIKADFESISGISNVAGSMYTTHVPIIAPKSNVAAYFNKRHTERNQKTSYSITVQGVVDVNRVFTDVCIGWPGSMPDDQVLEKSALSERANRGLLKYVWIVGNSGYPLMDWLLVPYNLQHLTWTQHTFNEKLGIIHDVAKEAFARLKKRWSCLQRRTEVKLQDLPNVLGACCVLHNICEMMNEEIEAGLDYQLFDDEMTAENSGRPFTAVQARDHIAHNLLHRGFAGTSSLYL